MKQGEDRHEKFNFWVWLGNGIKWFLQRVGTIVRTVLIIAIIGTAIGFCGKFIYEFFVSYNEKESKANQWVQANSRYLVGNLMPLPNTKKGSDFYTLLDGISEEEGEITLIVQVKEDGGVLQVKRIDSENVILVDSATNVPTLVLYSKSYARKVYDKEGMTLTEYIQNHFASGTTISSYDRLYVYIRKDLAVRYIHYKK